MIVKTPNVCGGRARIKDTRLPIWLIISLESQGVSVAGLLDAYSLVGLTLDDIKAARCYHTAHPKEIETDIQENNEQ